MLSEAARIDLIWRLSWAQQKTCDEGGKRKREKEKKEFLRCVMLVKAGAR